MFAGCNTTVGRYNFSGMLSSFLSVQLELVAGMGLGVYTSKAIGSITICLLLQEGKRLMRCHQEHHVVVYAEYKRRHGVMNGGLKD